jgi:hypothetical protein
VTTPPASDAVRRLLAEQTTLAAQIVTSGRWPRNAEQPAPPPAKAEPGRDGGQAP